MKSKISNYTIATLGSHTALQILKGARDEGFKTLCICQMGREQVYKNFGVADEMLTLKKYTDFLKLESQIIKKNAIIIPHGSYVEYIKTENIEKLKIPYYGSKKILNWESNRTKQHKWLKKAGLKLPKIFKRYQDIDRPVIIKFHGAGGGKDYFIANSPAEFKKHMDEYDFDKPYVIQEYIIGVPMYAHYFYSRIRNELEIMGFDKRYESNADSIGRIAARDQMSSYIKTSYTIAGNTPVVIRESLLPEIYDLGLRVIKTASELEQGGLWGPFCLEGIIDPQLNFYVFEISARIVAGTNPYINGSPYTWLKYDEPMSTGRRIARDIKEAIEAGKLNLAIG